MREREERKEGTKGRERRCGHAEAVGEEANAVVGDIERREQMELLDVPWQALNSVGRQVQIL